MSLPSSAAFTLGSMQGIPSNLSLINKKAKKVNLAGYETDTTQPPLDGYKCAYVYDPFENRIELMEKE